MISNKIPPIKSRKFTEALDVIAACYLRTFDLGDYSPPGHL